jgi:RHS repeat-associated protein
MPQQLIQKNGAKVWGGEFRAFGELTAETGAWENRLRFPGQYYDQESDNYYNYFRDYDSTTGRYLQSDPIGLQGGLNTYAYVLGNPLRYIDPTGNVAIVVVVPYLPIIGQAIVDAVAVGVGLCGLGVICDDPNEYVAPGNQGDTEIEGDYGEDASSARQCGQEPPNKCDWLKEQARQGKYSKARIKKQAKKWGCKRRRQY